MPILEHGNGANTNLIDIEENGIRLKLTVVDTPGFGDFINNDEWWVKYPLALNGRRHGY